MREFIFLLLIGVAGTAALAVAWAANGSEAVSEPAVDPERTAAIAATCSACHGTEGRIRTAIPAIAGQPEAVLAAQLLAFREDAIPGATVMPRLAKGYTEDELRAVASYFAAQSPEPVESITH